MPLKLSLMKLLLPRWARGFVRIFVVLYVIVWLGFSVYVLKSNADNLWLIQQHVSPWLANPAFPSGGDWCVIMASEQFLRLSDEEKRRLAEAFFDSEIEPLAQEFLYDVPRFREWFSDTSVLTLKEAPLRTWKALPNWPVGESVQYREIPLTDMPTYRLWRYFLNLEILGISFVLSAVVLIPILLVFYAIRWVVKGFRQN